MIDDVMSGARVIGILQPIVAGDDDQESPIEKSAALRSVGCAGRVTSYQELDDGRSDHHVDRHHALSNASAKPKPKSPIAS